MNKKNNKFSFKKICFILSIIGLTLTLIYIFKTSTCILTSDSVITDVLAHEQKMNKQFLLKNWYYGNEFWFFSLSIPTFLLSFFMSNQILIRQISVLITAIIFFFILYKYGKKFLNKKDVWILIAIFISGISYSILDYFYAFNAYLTVVINSMLLLFMYFKSFEEENSKKIYYILGLVFTFLFNIGSLRYLPSVVLPFILTECFFIISDNLKVKNVKEFILKNTKIKKLLFVFLIAVCAFCTYKLLTINLYFEARASDTEYTKLGMKSIKEGIDAIFECIFNFFGYDNQNHPNVFMMTSDYFLEQYKQFSLLSIRGIAYTIKFIISIIFIVITPITLFKRFKENDHKIQFLIVFNAISWIIMIYSYLFMDGFFYNSSELKYFIFNIILNIILGIYCIFKFYAIKLVTKVIFECLLIFYVIANIYQTSVIVVEHDQKALDRRYELVNVLKENNLTFGYADFWDGLMTYYLSNYKITTVSVITDDRVSSYRWYSDKRWYDSGYHTGKTFLALNSNGKLFKDFYKMYYGNPDKIVETDNYTVFIYNKNPFDNEFEKEND